jgi:hypothetical protein
MSAHMGISAPGFIPEKDMLPAKEKLLSRTQHHPNLSIY